MPNNESLKHQEVQSGVQNHLIVDWLNHSHRFFPAEEESVFQKIDRDCHGGLNSHNLNEYPDVLDEELSLFDKLFALSTCPASRSSAP